MNNKQIAEELCQEASNHEAIASKLRAAAKLLSGAAVLTFPRHSNVVDGQCGRSRHCDKIPGHIGQCNKNRKRVA